MGFDQPDGILDLRHVPKAGVWRLPVPYNLIGFTQWPLGLRAYTSPMSSNQISGWAAMNSFMSSTHSAESRLTTSTPRARR